MAQYPVEDQAGLFEAVNYLLSGPSGLGQNFNGFSAYKPAWVTGTFRQPYTVPLTTSTIPPILYSPPVSINNITPLEVNTVTNETRLIQIDFTPQSFVPFSPGDTVVVAGVVDASTATNFYNDTYSRSVLVGTSSTTIIQTQGSYQWPAYVSGGTIEKNNALGYISTDANARVTVQGPTELVFISSQLTLNVAYTCTTTSTFDVTVAINRYRGSKDTGVGATDYVFEFDATVSQQTKSYASTSSGIVDVGQNIFTTVLDQPSFGYYWYITEILFTANSGDVKPVLAEVGLRSTTAQVIKQ